MSLGSGQSLVWVREREQGRVKYVPLLRRGHSCWNTAEGSVGLHTVPCRGGTAVTTAQVASRLAQIKAGVSLSDWGENGVINDPFLDFMKGSPGLYCEGSLEKKVWNVEVQAATHILGLPAQKKGLHVLLCWERSESCSRLLGNDTGRGYGKIRKRHRPKEWKN